MGTELKQSNAFVYTLEIPTDESIVLLPAHFTQHSNIVYLNIELLFRKLHD